ncbi:MAG: alpha/beta hydrolase [Acidobacteriaceae bacterium]
MDILSRPPPPADHRIHYGTDPLQFGDLRLPPAKAGEGLPVVVFIHGGWWQSTYDLEYGGHLCAALKGVGVATWSLEYRRVGNPGGGWPGTMQDVATGFDFLRMLAYTYSLDLNRVVAMGHSAGGHLAFWLAGRHHIPPSSPLHNPQPIVSLAGVIALAGAVDLRLTIDLGGILHFTSGKPAVIRLMGGLPGEVEDRYHAANPGDLLPLGVPQMLFQGSDDDQIPPTLPGRWADNARRQGDQATVTIIPNADHFDVVDPESKAWPIISAAILHSLAVSKH